MLSVGVSFSVPIWREKRPDLIVTCWGAFSSPTWQKQLRTLSVRVAPGKDYPRRGVLRKSERETVVKAMLRHPDVCAVRLATSDRYEQARLVVAVQPWIYQSNVAFFGHQWISDNGPHQHDAWVAEMLEFAAQMRAFHGVIPVMQEPAVYMEQDFCGITHNGLLQHPEPAQYERMSSARDELGVRYLRFPRWGTLYSHAQVDALGGIERIQREVGPAVIREIGTEAVYFQLTASVTTATSEEALQKERAFTKLAEPLLPPRHR